MFHFSQKFHVAKERANTKVKGRMPKKMKISQNVPCVSQNVPFCSQKVPFVPKMLPLFSQILPFFSNSSIVFSRCSSCFSKHYFSFQINTKKNSKYPGRFLLKMIQNKFSKYPVLILKYFQKEKISRKPGLTQKMFQKHFFKTSRFQNEKKVLCAYLWHDLALTGLHHFSQL